MTTKKEAKPAAKKRIRNTATPERLGEHFTPPKRQRRGIWSDRLAQANREPGVWFGVTLGSRNSVYTTIKNLRKHEGFEFSSDGENPGRVCYRKMA